ncbi:Uronyl 2-sulfotransferase [Halotydeus destructor]|nr:Uronyl 2-sulfotransferase [Halotydeus destructor]
MLDQPSLRRRKKVEYILFATSMVGFLAQLLQLTLFYLEYKVITRTQVVTPAIIELPAIYVCTQHVQYFDGPNGSLADRLINAFHYKEMELLCQVLHGIDKYVPCDSLTDTRVYYSSELLCVAKFENDDLLSGAKDTGITYPGSRLYPRPLFEYTAKIVRQEAMANRAIFSIGNKMDAKFRVRNSDSVVALNGNLTSQLSMTFSRKYFSYMPPPYPSHCLDYKLRFDLERRELVDRCLLASSVKYPSNVLTTMNSEYASKGIEVLEDEDFQNTTRACQESYPHVDCEDMGYYIEVQSEMYAPGGVADTVNFKLYRFNGPDMSVMEEPRLDWFSFSVNLGGFMSLWLGISFVDVISKATKVSFKLARRGLHRKTFVPKRSKLAHITRIKLTRIHVIFVMAVMAGCVVHMMLILADAIEEPFKIETLLSKPTTFTLPSISICGHRQENLDSIDSNPNSLLRRFLSNGTKLYQVLSIRELMMVISKSNQVIDLNRSFINDPNAVQRKYESLYNTKLSITRLRQCVTLFSPKQRLSEGKPLIYVTADFVMLLLGKIWLRKGTADTPFTVTYHDGDTIVGSRSSSDTLHFSLPSNLANYYQMSYEIVSSSKVGNHRKSKCIDYSTLNFESQFDATRDCIIKTYQRKNPGFWPPEVFAPQDADLYNHNIDAKFSTAWFPKIARACSQQYPYADCSKTHYTPKVTWSLKYNRKNRSDDKYTQLQLNAPYGVAISFNQSLRYRVPKCGGTTMVTLLRTLSKRNNFSHVTSHVYDKRLLSPVEQVEMFRELTNHSYDRLSYDRHFYFIDFTTFGEHSVKYINMVRDPVDMVISSFHYRRLVAGKRNSSTSRWLSKDFNECVVKGDPECSYERDKYTTAHLVPYFCGQDIVCEKMNDKSALERAKDNVDKHFVVVGILEQFNRTLKVLEKLLPQYFEGATDAFYSDHGGQHLNSHVTEYYVTDKARALLKKNLSLDYELYDYLVEKLERQFKLG